MARYTRVKESIALITLNNPPVNALSAAVRRGIVESVSRALKDEQVKAVVFCGKGGNFCGGADIKEFSGSLSGPPLVPLIHSIEAGEKLMVAAVEGVALGGGLELALGCHYRVANTKARMGLPEVTLGLLPAAGGTQRLPRLIGISAALELITTGRHVSAQEALQLGIVEQVTEGNAVQAAMELALSVIGQPLNPRRLSLRAPVWAPDVDGVCEAALLQVKRRSRGAMAPVACVQAVRAAAMLPYSKGMEKERQLMDTLFRSSQAQAMQYAFFAQRNAGKWSLPNGAQWNNIQARDVQRAGVIGKKPAVLMLLHSTRYPKDFNPDRFVLISNMIAVDCLFCEDQGFLQCSENDNALAYIMTWLDPEDISKRTPGNKSDWNWISNWLTKPPSLKYFTLKSGKSLGLKMNMERKLQEQYPGLKKVENLEKSDLILVFCSVVSRAGTDIEAAVKLLSNEAGNKPAVLLVLHHTFDPNHIVPEISRAVKREKTIAVDFLFLEDQGLLTCSQNHDALSRVVNWLHHNKK